MRRLVLATLMFAIAGAVVAPAVTAQTNSTPNGTAAERDVLATVGTDAELVSVTVDDTNETATATVRATRSTTTVVVTDASPELTGAVTLAQSRAVVNPGDEVDITVPLADPAQPAVTVATRSGIVGWGDQSRGLFTGSPGWRDVQGAAVGGAIAGSVPGIVIAFRRLRRDEEDIDRVI